MWYVKGDEEKQSKKQQQPKAKWQDKAMFAEELSNCLQYVSTVGDLSKKFSTNPLKKCNKTEKRK